MEEKDRRRKQIDQANIKAKSKQSKAEKKRAKKMKAKGFHQTSQTVSKKKIAKNLKRWK